MSARHYYNKTFKKLETSPKSPKYVARTPFPSPRVLSDAEPSDQKLDSSIQINRKSLKNRNPSVVKVENKKSTEEFILNEPSTIIGDEIYTQMSRYLDAKNTQSSTSATPATDVGVPSAPGRITPHFVELTLDPLHSAEDFSKGNADEGANCDENRDRGGGDSPVRSLGAVPRDLVKEEEIFDLQECFDDVGRKMKKIRQMFAVSSSDRARVLKKYPNTAQDSGDGFISDPDSKTALRQDQYTRDNLLAIRSNMSGKPFWRESIKPLTKKTFETDLEVRLRRMEIWRNNAPRMWTTGLNDRKRHLNGSVPRSTSAQNISKSSSCCNRRNCPINTMNNILKSRKVHEKDTDTLPDNKDKTSTSETVSRSKGIGVTATSHSTSQNGISEIITFDSTFSTGGRYYGDWPESKLRYDGKSDFQLPNLMTRQTLTSSTASQAHAFCGCKGCKKVTGFGGLNKGQEAKVKQRGAAKESGTVSRPSGSQGSEQANN